MISIKAPEAILSRGTRLPEELLSSPERIPPLCNEAYLWHLFYVPEKYLLVSGDGRRPVVIYELVQRVELHHPEEVLPGPVPEHLEVLHVVPKPGEGRGTHGDQVRGLCPGCPPGPLARRSPQPGPGPQQGRPEGEGAPPPETLPQDRRPPVTF